MTVSLSSTPTDKSSYSTLGRIFFLDNVGGRVVSINPDGSNSKVLVDGLRGHPDGIIVDVHHGQIYWTNMGEFTSVDGTSAPINDGSILRGTQYYKEYK
jgi:hypothetical protein